MDRASRELIRALTRSYGFWVSEAVIEGARCKQRITDLARWTKADAVRVATPEDYRRELFYVRWHARNAARNAGVAAELYTKIKGVLGVE